MSVILNGAMQGIAQSKDMVTKFKQKRIQGRFITTVHRPTGAFFICVILLYSYFHKLREA